MFSCHPLPKEGERMGHPQLVSDFEFQVSRKRRKRPWIGTNEHWQRPRSAADVLFDAPSAGSRPGLKTRHGSAVSGRANTSLVPNTNRLFDCAPNLREAQSRLRNKSRSEKQCERCAQDDAA